MGPKASRPEDIEPQSDAGIEMKVSEMCAKIFLSCAKKLLESAASTLPDGKLISDKFSSVVLAEESTDLDLEKLIENIKMIVRDELSQNEIDKVRGLVQVQINWLNVQFKNMVDTDANWSKKELYDELKKKTDVFEMEAMKILLQERYITAYSGAAVPTFVLAANVHLSMLQDLARLDGRVWNPHDSAHAKDVKDIARNYADFVLKMTEKVLKDREDKVYMSELGAPMGPPVQFWVDRVTGQQGQDYTSIGEPAEEEAAEEEYNTRKTAVRDQLHEVMGRPMDVAEVWKELVDNPLGIQVR